MEGLLKVVIRRGAGLCPAGRARPTRNVLVGLCLSAAAIACGDDGRTSEAFCTTLDDGIAAMGANLDTIDEGDFVSELGAGAANLGEFTRVVHRLADVAPDEIRTDMEQAAEAWTAEAEALGQAASDPLGALGAGLSSAVFNAGFYAAVDDFALDRCGQAVFGL